MAWFKFKFLYFVCAFLIGLVLCYVMEPPPVVVVKFPTPYSAGTVLYHGDEGKCYRYDADMVECPLDRGKIRAQPKELNESR